MDVQNRLSRATPRLPAAVTQQGVRVDKSRSNFLLFTILSSDNPDIDPMALGDYASRNVVPELQRVPGVGQAQLFGTERAMRIWIDPAKLQGYNLSSADVNAAIRAQNAQVASGTIGDLPNMHGPGDRRHGGGQRPALHRRAVRQHRAARQHRRLDRAAADVARIELGGQAYATSARLNGQPAVGIGVQLAPSGNALAAAKAVRAKMDELVALLPAGREVDHSVRQLALRQHLHHRGGEDAVRGGGAGVPGDVPVPAELALHHHPDHRGADRAAGHLRRAARRWASRSTC